MRVGVYACMRVCVYACMRVCVYACMRVCMYACMHVCVYACMCLWRVLQLRDRSASPPHLVPVLHPAVVRVSDPSVQSEPYLLREAPQHRLLDEARRALQVRSVATRLNLGHSLAVAEPPPDEEGRARRGF